MAASTDPPELSPRDRAVLYVDLRHYFERLFVEHGNLHASDQQALTVALESMNQRLATMNEFRGSLEDMTRQMVKRDVFDIVTNRLTIVENTYLPRVAYQDDIAKVTIRFEEGAKERERRIIELEKNVVTKTALEVQSQAAETAIENQRRESERSRKNLTYALVAVGFAAVLNFFINVYQGARGGG